MFSVLQLCHVQSSAITKCALVPAQPPAQTLLPHFIALTHALKVASATKATF